MRILACADIHMGRKPVLAQSGHSSWDAIMRKPSVLQSMWLYWSVMWWNRKKPGFRYRPCSKDYRRSRKRVSGHRRGGNHDWNIFPAWCRTAMPSRSSASAANGKSLDIGCVRFLGWSFRSSHEEANPLKEFPSDLPNPSLINLGLLHADYGTLSAYAPVQEQDLLHSGVDLWMLGHIHKKGRVRSSQGILLRLPVRPRCE